MPEQITNAANDFVAGLMRKEFDAKTNEAIGATSTATNATPSLTFDEFVATATAALETLPAMHYVTTEFMEAGRVVKVPPTDGFPEFIVFHPDDFEEIKRIVDGQAVLKPLDEKECLRVWSRLLDEITRGH